MQIIQTKDVNFISSILNDTRVKSWLSDDCSPNEFVPIINDEVLYLTEETNKGIIKIEPMNGICCQVHIAVLLPSSLGGEKTREFVQKVIAWGFENTRYIKAVAMIPEYNKFAIRLAEKVGFEKEGELKKSFLKNWKLYNQVIYGLTKEEWARKYLCGGRSCQQ